MHADLQQKDFIDEWIVPTAASIVSNKQWRKTLPEDLNSSQSGTWVRKSFVCSKASIKKLNTLSEESGISRDMLFLLAISLQKLKLDHLHQKHQQAAEIIEELSSRFVQYSIFLLS